MTCTRRTLLRTGLAGSAAAFALPLVAQHHAFPGSQTIRLVVPYPPGGGTDTVSRLITEQVTGETGWSIVIDNKPGAGGNIGMDAVAKARADGLTIGMGQTANLAINPSLLPRMPFDPAKDFAPVILVASLPVVVVVRADASYENLSQLLTAAKAKPGALKQALAGAGTVGHLASELLCSSTGVKVLNVPYKGASQALTELVGGQSDFMLAAPSAVTELLKAKRLRALAVTSRSRLPILPHVPTVAESGHPGFEATDWKAIVAPAQTPGPVVARLHAAFDRALGKPATIAKLALEGSAPLGGSSDAAAKYIRAEQAKWAGLIRTAGIRLE
jgi:tripartite-type tricarboxylate transporter receptor subunit TctC